MPSVPKLSGSVTSKIENQISRFNEEGTFHDLPGWLFKNQVIYLYKPRSNSESVSSFSLHLASNLVRFAGATFTSKFEDKRITHILLDQNSESTDIPALRVELSKLLSSNNKIPHIVTVDWVKGSWKERTLLDEEHM